MTVENYGSIVSMDLRFRLSSINLLDENDFRKRFNCIDLGAMFSSENMFKKGRNDKIFIFYRKLNLGIIKKNR